MNDSTRLADTHKKSIANCIDYVTIARPAGELRHIPLVTPWFRKYLRGWSQHSAVWCGVDDVRHRHAVVEARAISINYGWSWRRAVGRPTDRSRVEWVEFRFILALHKERTIPNLGQQTENIPAVWFCSIQNPYFHCDLGKAWCSFCLLRFRSELNVTQHSSICQLCQLGCN